LRLPDGINKPEGGARQLPHQHRAGVAFNQEEDILKEGNSMKDFKNKLRKFLPKLRDAKEKNLNEADTRMRIRLMLSEVLGYDLLDEITQEHMIQSHYVDLTVKAPLWDKKAGKYQPKIVYFIEAKSIDTTLRDTHAYQANNYAASGGVNLSLLTNSVDYRLYHLTWDKIGVQNSMILSFNLLDDDFNDMAEKLFLLSKESFKKGIIEKYIAETTSLSDKNLVMALLSERVLNAIRLELKNIAGHNIRNEAIEKQLSNCFGTELYEMARGCIKKSDKKKNKPKGKIETTQPEFCPLPPGKISSEGTEKD
jgi:hypothetical protein